MSRLALIPNIEIVAVADIWDHHLAEGKKTCGGKRSRDQRLQRATCHAGH